MAPHNQTEGGRSSRGQRPHVEENTLRTERLQVERKTFIFALRENPRGRFLRITEDVNGRRDHIIVPAPGLADFARIVQEIVSHQEEFPDPPVSNPPAERSAEPPETDEESETDEPPSN
ncbi:MAG: RNA-binding protein [Verrucomicrobiae bacterium]|nr:RNA-binding protein [Verrucomicrobiae bacterium]MCP5521231.1 RNA-binding protein [Verrucomicrobiales bacterium]